MYIMRPILIISERDGIPGSTFRVFTKAPSQSSMPLILEVQPYHQASISLTRSMAHRGETTPSSRRNSTFARCPKQRPSSYGISSWSESSTLSRSASVGLLPISEPRCLMLRSGEDLITETMCSYCQLVYLALRV